MHTGLYTTYKNISERVLRIIDADNYDDSDAQVFIADALNLIGVHHAYEPKKCFIDIEQHRGELPKDITYMIAVRGNSYKNGITSHTIASTEIPQTNITTDLTGNGNPNTVLGSGTFAGQTYLDTNSENTYEWDGSTWIFLQSTRNPMASGKVVSKDYITSLYPMRYNGASFHYTYYCDSDIVNNKVPSSCNMTYTLASNHIFTSFDSGIVEIAYRAIPISEKGEPLIPNNRTVQLALEAYVIERIGYKLLIRGKIDSGVYQKMQQERDWYMGAATSDLSTPSPDEMESIANVWQSFFTHGSHSTAWEGTGSSEHLKPHPPKS